MSSANSLSNARASVPGGGCEGRVDINATGGVAGAAEARAVGARGRGRGGRGDGGSRGENGESGKGQRQRLELAQHQARVEINVAADGKDGDAAVSEGEVGLEREVWAGEDGGLEL